MFRFRLRPSLFAVLLTLICVSACAPQTTPTPFRPPTQPQPTQLLATTTPVPALFTSAPTTPTATITLTVPGPCTNNLSFLDDITIEDNTSVLPNAVVDKQWLVQNDGTCNWDSTYRLKLIGGDPLGVEQEQVMFPARAGTQATLRILFTAPTTEGTYESAWQAYGPDDVAFGDPIFIKIVVSP
ncbi:MAG: hypothetical protein H7Y59_11195 [Anaerolineales bacterium]|nr:hypothetical protein [Anaerolineales bacterium]